MTEKPSVTIYTDGGASPNPGPGGWGAILITERDGKKHERELSGGAEHSTNNRMELTAAIEALRALNRPCIVEFYTDSQYLKRGISEWMEKWLETDFKRGKIENADLCMTVFTSAKSRFTRPGTVIRSEIPFVA